MDQDSDSLPDAGSEVAPGEDTVTSKTARRVEPEPPEPVAEERAAGAWTGQYPDPAAEQAPLGGKPAPTRRATSGTENCPG